MKTIERAKTFDCVKLKNDIQARIYAETKGMSTVELLVYFNRQSGNIPYPLRGRCRCSKVRES